MTGREWTRRGIAALLATGAAPAAPSHAQRAEPAIERALDEAQAGLGEIGRGWSRLLSPAFPTEWPPNWPRGPGTGSRRYVFAYSIGGIADGVRLSGPWAAVEQRPGETARVILLGAPAPLGVQGVRPLSGEETALAAREAEIGALLGAPPDAGAAALIRAVHCGWARRVGVAARAVAPRHPAFVTWLGCG